MRLFYFNDGVVWWCALWGIILFESKIKRTNFCWLWLAFCTPIASLYFYLCTVKFLTVILSLTIFVLSAKPCSDGQNFEDQHEDKMSIEHNHQEDSDDSCPVTCICNCCGMSITYEPLSKYEFKFYPKISTQTSTTYVSFYRFDFLSNIWQPPQVIS